MFRGLTEKQGQPYCRGAIPEVSPEMTSIAKCPLTGLSSA